MSGSRSLIGESAAFRRALAEADRLACTSLPVVLYGPSGTGKESLARRIHDQSARAGGPFVVIDCTKFPRELIESTLFGHERGAFTGATGSRTGLFELAHSGTAFLDEVAELPLEQQPKLLRVLQEGTVLPVGASKPRQVDVRIVAATNRNLAEMVRRGEFREDLYWRIVGHCVLLPSLQDRDGDVVEIAEQLLQRIVPRKALTEPARELLRTYGWPGNVRQLENVIEGSAALTPGRWIDRDTVWHQIQVIEHFGVMKDPEPAPATAASPYDTLLAFVEENGPTTAGRMRAVIGLAKSTCYRLLKRLEADGRIRREGQGVDTRYVAADDAEARLVRADATSQALTDRQREILRVLEQGAWLARREIQARLSDSPTARMLHRDLQSLRLNGMVCVRGHGRGAEWSLVPQR